ncbi:MAG: gas vesicle protein [Chloroflexales bacterium]|nr:gas vesicle protein [Chloroflexales bacterium]
MNRIEMVQRAKDQLAQLTGFKAESISGMQWTGDSWNLTVELLELKRIPNTGDVLATYEVAVDNIGNLITYQRTRRYLRGQMEERL